MLSVTTAASDLTFLTMAELRQAVQQPDGNDASLEALNRRVAASIVTACRVVAAGATPPTLRLEAVADTFRLKSHQSSLILSRRPVVSIASVTEAETVLDADEYEVDASSGILIRLSNDTPTCWPCGKIIVAYSAGYETVPERLKLAAMKLAGVLYSEGQVGDQNAKRINIPGVYEIERWVAPPSDTLIPQEILDLLQPDMNHWVG